jgi:hypothetical protein
MVRSLLTDYPQPPVKRLARLLAPFKSFPRPYSGLTLLLMVMRFVREIRRWRQARTAKSPLEPSAHTTNSHAP